MSHEAGVEISAVCHQRPSRSWRGHRGQFRGWCYLCKVKDPNTNNYSDFSNHCQHTTAMASSPQTSRAGTLGPILAIPKKLSFRDKRLYECNYESIDSWSSGSNDNNDAYIKRLESSVKCVDSIIGKPKLYDSRPSALWESERSNKIYYDSITVLPSVTPPPPLPRARSFKQPRARTVLPLSPGPGSVSGGRARSAPPIPPGRQRVYNER